MPPHLEGSGTLGEQNQHYSMVSFHIDKLPLRTWKNPLNHDKISKFSKLLAVNGKVTHGTSEQRGEQT
jgi:hypothetical protein